MGKRQGSFHVQIWRHPALSWDDSRVITDQGTRYECSACDSTVLLATGVLDVPMHPCPGRGGMAVPYTPAGVRSKVELNARQDYVGAEDVQRDSEGRVWMSVTVTTDEYEHVAAYAPCAHAGISE